MYANLIRTGHYPTEQQFEHPQPLWWGWRLLAQLFHRTRG
jgi:hypothetical protein